MISLCGRAFIENSKAPAPICGAKLSNPAEFPYRRQSFFPKNGDICFLIAKFVA